MPKSTRPMVRIHNSETNEVIDRQMNDAEFATFELEQAANALRAAEVEAKATAKTAIFNRLGLTPEEVALLFP
jgi:hypothetical protein